MLESGVPVVNGYIADIHGNEHIPGAVTACNGAPAALGSGHPCYIAQAQYYNPAFGTFFQRLAADGITPAEHAVRAQLGRGRPRGRRQCGPGHPAHPGQLRRRHRQRRHGHPGRACTYPAGSFGELAGNMTGLLATQKNDTTPFSLESDTAPEFYVTGNPGPNAPAGPHAGTGRGRADRGQPLHGHHPEDHELPGRPGRGGDPAHGQRRPGQDADVRDVRQAGLLPEPRRRPTAAAPCVTVNPGFAYNHGDYAAEINTNYVGLRRPRRQAPRPGRHHGRRRARTRPGRTAARSTVPGSGTTGTWVDETDIRPTLMYLTGPEGRLRARRPGHHRDPHRPEPRAGRAGRGQPGRLLQAAQLQRRPVRRPSPCMPRRPPSSRAPQATPSTGRSTPP